MSGRPWERFQRPETQAQSDLPMQIAAAGAMRGDALQMATRAAAAKSPPAQYPHKIERYSGIRLSPWVRRFVQLKNQSSRAS
jgi:hypothetical protein